MLLFFSFALVLFIRRGGNKLDHVFSGIMLLCELLLLIFFVVKLYFLITTAAIIGNLLGGFLTLSRHKESRSFLLDAILFIPKLLASIVSIILIVTAISPIPLAIASRSIYSFLYKPFESTESSLVLEGGYKFYPDISYGKEKMDIYIAGRNAPTYIFLHGGGYIWGDKGASSGNLQGYFDTFLKAGINVVSLNYTLAPEGRYPLPLKRISEAVEFLQTNGPKYGISLSEVVFGGSSAGAQLAGQFVLLQCNEAYAARLGINPVMEKENIKAVIFNSALIDPERLGSSCRGNPFLDYFWTQCGRAYFGGGFLKGNPQAQEASLITFMESSFPPSFISDANTASFYDQAEELYYAMTVLGVDADFNYYDRSMGKTSHGFEMGDSPYALDNDAKMVQFLARVL